MNNIKSLLLLSTLIVSTNINAALLTRLGGLAYYDDVANLTWLADANYAQTQYAISGGTEGDLDGLMFWAEATSWVSTLNVAGVTGWRLPDTVDIGNDGVTYTNFFQGVDAGYNFTATSELSNMYYNILGNTPLVDVNGVRSNCTVPDFCLTERGPFSNLQANFYWSSTEYILNPGRGWYFDMSTGFQFGNDEANLFYAWAVKSGDVSAVPLPAAVWLFCAGLFGLIRFARLR